MLVNLGRRAGAAQGADAYCRGMIAHDPTDVLPLSAELVDRWKGAWGFSDLSEPMLSLADHLWGPFGLPKTMRAMTPRSSGITSS